MTNELSSEPHSDKVWIINAVCLNCNKRFTSMRGISMHLRITGMRHVVSFINHGNYDKKTGLREMSPELNFNLSDKVRTNVQVIWKGNR